MRKSEQWARRYMTGTRQGSDRPSWEHPHDLVKLLSELRASSPMEDDEDFEFRALQDEGFDRMCDVAWLHDLLEDTEVTFEDLAREFSITTAEAVRALSQREGEEKTAYLDRLSTVTTGMTAVVKVADRICNLREGKASFSTERWQRYVLETNRYIMPLLDKVSDPDRSWLRERLEMARDARPIV